MDTTVLEEWRAAGLKLFCHCKNRPSDARDDNASNGYADLIIILRRKSLRREARSAKTSAQDALSDMAATAEEKK